MERTVKFQVILMFKVTDVASACSIHRNFVRICSSVVRYLCEIEVIQLWLASSWHMRCKSSHVP